MKNKHFVLLLLITAIALMVIALYNGFPLAEGDTGAYIQQAIYPHFAPDRPPFYGIFIRITCLWTSLWFPVFVQCLILSFLLLQFIGLIKIPDGREDSNEPAITGVPKEFRLTLLIALTIIAFTCVSWVSSYLMPDIFAGILLLAIVLFLRSPDGNRKLQALYIVIILLAISVHNSHFLITILFSLLLVIVSWVKKRMILIVRSITLISISMVVFLTMCTMNAAKKYGFTFSRGKDIFMVAKLAETGILNTYLDENCDKRNLKLCSYKTQIPPGFSEFLWDPESPFYKMGGWDSCREEYGVITHDIFTSPRYMLMFARKSVVSTLRELTQVQAPDRVLPEGKETQPWEKVRQYFADELREYNQSLQNSAGLSATSCNYFYYLFFILSSAWVAMFYSRVRSEELGFIYWSILWFLLINAFVTSTFATVIYRFQYRIFWILPATNAIIIFKYYFRKCGKNVT